MCNIKLFRDIVNRDKRSLYRLEVSASWMYGQPRLLPVCQQPGYMVTALAAHPGDSIIFGLLGDIFRLNKMRCNEILVIKF